MVIEKIPVLDLQKQYAEIGADLERRVLEVLRSGHYILGPHLSHLEALVADMCSCTHGIGVANGTDALILALWALGVGPGDEVITTPFTFAATAEAIALRGAKAVFVDIDPATFNLNPDLIEAAVTKKTKAILPVHLYGLPADMDRITAIANRYNLKVIEDNAQAIGALYKQKPTGALSNAACISFYPTKNLGACGDAGMIVTNNPETAERLKVLRAHGMRTRYYHDELGVNSRLDELQAVALLTKLPYLPTWNEKRRQVAAWYAEALADCPNLRLPSLPVYATPVWHQYTVCVLGNKNELRDELQQQLAAEGIGSMCYYPVPLHRQKAFSDLGYGPGSFPAAEMVSQQVLSLPMYPELEAAQVNRVASAIKRFMQARTAISVPTTTAPPVFG
jgi:dTDP-4-amino-4,6-dideoxygalactose transaminase